MPVTEPVAGSTVAMAVLEELQVPPDIELVNEVAAVAQTVEGPDMVPADAAGSTVTGVEATEVEQAVVTL